ncbi:MAG TPA: DNA polymerase III subunit gamma and tau [Actinobacteria bacterium]|nr:DNA polymerase III subunit gamma and tau [Actinomycetota bacterium]
MSLALYRRYRPETFAEVIGQDHVTGPLVQALAAGRVHHAFLFSGPRGCGKTTSARILARALNCEQGPTPTPCGQCQSCQDLANGGPGSLDVIEIDAASHGGVDDARDLRERAFYAPVSSRYKVYIIDEAHMVTREGFNALLKLVEEPPEHLKFVFATTEPDKVLATIRSRTHHYAFRLVAPRVLSDHLARVATDEGVSVDDAVLPLVVRAAAGSVRDALSVLDQLIAGSTDNSVSLAYASGLLGYTDAHLLDEVVDAYAARSGAAVFQALDRALDSGLDPRRFVADLLERFRDLLILSIGGRETEHLEALVTAAPDQFDRLMQQAARFGIAELTRNAEVLSEGLVEMRGATSPRLLLEIMAARLLLPSADDAERGLQVRLEQLERQVRSAGGNSATAPVRPRQDAPLARASAARAAATPEPSSTSSKSAPSSDPADPPPPAAAEEATAPVASVAALEGVESIGRYWPQIVDAVREVRRSAWTQLMRDGAGVLSMENNTLTIGLGDPGTAKGFLNSGYDTLLADAVATVTGQRPTIVVVGQPAAAVKAAAKPSRAQRASTKQASTSTATSTPAPVTTEVMTDDAAGDADDDLSGSHDELTGEALLAAALDATAIGDIDPV